MRLILAFLLAVPLHAANVYIRDGAAGSGASWSDALDDLPATLNRGDTYYIADGSYAAYTFNDALSGSTYIYIKKATGTDHGTETGWSSTYGDGVAIWPNWTFTTGYYDFDGQVGGGPSSWTSGHGFRLNADPAKHIYASVSNVDNLIFRHLEVQGGGDDGTVTDFALVDRGVHAVSGSYDNWTFSECYFHDFGNMPFQFSGITGLLIEYCYVARNESTAGEHAEGIYLLNGTSCIIRHSMWDTIDGTGVIVISGSGHEIYGNVIWDSVTGNGSITGWSSYAVSNAKIYNNTIVDGTSWNSGVEFPNSGGGNLAYNNVYINNTTVNLGGTTHNYSVFSDANARGEANAQTSATTAIFTSYAGNDFTLATATTAGTILTGYETDLNGDTRGADGTWDRGAYEFNDSTCTDLPDITSALTAYGTNGIAFSYQITVDCAATNYASGTLPNGLTLDADTGLISGTPDVVDPPTTNVVSLCASNSFGGSCTNVTFIIRAPTPVLSVTPQGIAYGEVLDDTVSDQYFYVTNTGGGTLSGTAEDASSPWSIVGTATYSLGAGEGTSILVRFSPTAKGVYSGTIEFTGGAGATNEMTGYCYPLISGTNWNWTNALIYAPFQVTDTYLHQTNESYGLVDSGRAVYGLNLSYATVFTLNGYVYAPAGTNDSFYFRVTSEPTDPDYIWDIIPFATNTPTYDTRWVNLRGSGTFDNPEFPTNQFSLSSGTHKLILLGREPDTRINQMDLNILSESSGSGKGRGQKGTGGRGRRR